MCWTGDDTAVRKIAEREVVSTDIKYLGLLEE